MNGLFFEQLELAVQKFAERITTLTSEQSAMRTRETLGTELCKQLDATISMNLRDRFHYGAGNLRTKLFNTDVFTKQAISKREVAA